jgi:hypothetical protein
MHRFGGLCKHPHIAIREYLDMTMSFDHDIIDGAPAARLAMRLKELIESGFGLIDTDSETESAASSGNHLSAHG